MAGMSTCTSPHCARWRNAWSITTNAKSASAMGVARIPATWVVAAFGHHLYSLEVLVNRITWTHDRTGGLDGDTHFQVLTRADAAQHTTCMVGGKALRRQSISMHSAAVRNAGKTSTNLHAFDGI
jgi:hypothetical protein